MGKDKKITLIQFDPYLLLIHIKKQEVESRNHIKNGAYLKCQMSSKYFKCR